MLAPAPAPALVVLVVEGAALESERTAFRERSRGAPPSIAREDVAIGLAMVGSRRKTGELVVVIL